MSWTPELVADNYFVLWSPCPCRGDPECDCVDRQRITDEIDLSCLMQNIAVAGALCAAFDIGQTYGLWLADPYIPAHPSPWRSGCGSKVPR